MANPLLRDEDVDFLLYDVLDAPSLCRLPYFADHDRHTFDTLLGSARRLAREVLFPAYRSMDQEPPRFVDGAILVHPRMKALYPQLAELGMAVAGRPMEMGGAQFPLLVTTLANAYLMAANLSAFGYVMLSAGAAHLLEVFANDEIREQYMKPLYDGRWTGTMALTEPQAGSSLADVATSATPRADGSFLIRGNKIFISGGDHDVTENVVNLTLARIDGAPAGTKGISLFCVPKRRLESGTLVDNDITVSGMIHKIGWRGLPSLALSFGDRGDCRGWLVGEPNRGLAAMFQMMNEARIMIGVNGVATATVAYHEARQYAVDRPQGRPLTAKDPNARPVPIVEHLDVRRMLLRQKAITEGGLALVARTALIADLAEHADDEAERTRMRLLLDLLTPVAKSFPAERGFEANTLAVQVHGGYGYSSEYLVEAWLRDQKLNSIHEGTTGIQGLDLLGRKVVAGGGAALGVLREEMERTFEDARKSGVDERFVRAVANALAAVEGLTMELAAKGVAGDVEGMLLHSTDYLDVFGILVVAWQHLAIASAATRKRARDDDEAAFLRGKLLAAEHWFAVELPRLERGVAVCGSGEDAHRRVRPHEL
jgi:butyryl-CoA dehydrogenase